ncbi:MAG: 3,4-dihydroxyphenylacetate 2,3-dioxygenase [Pseudomonadota bacterium]
MPLPEPNFTPPFNIIRCSHAVLDVTDLERSRVFYEEAIGLHVEDASADTLWLRGVEERNHHSLVLRRAAVPSCQRLGFKVGSEEDLERAEQHFASRGAACTFVDQPYQGRTLQVNDPSGMPLEFCFRFDQSPRLLQKYAHYKGCHPQRLDHFNCFSPDVQGSVDFYNGLGFRTTEYTEADGDDPAIWAAWMHRKGNVHDMAFTNGRGPRLHHIAYWVPTALNIIHLCDLMSTTGWLENMERGPGRHGISNAFFLYVRDPDGHRTEIYTSDYMTMDPDHEPIRWSLTDTQRQTLWGMPAPKSWFEEGSVFPGVEVVEPNLKAQPIVAH